MKFSIFMIAILILVGGFQYLRVTEISSYYSLDQRYDFQSREGVEGSQAIEKPQRHLLLYGSEDEAAADNLKKFFEFSKADYDEKNIYSDLEKPSGYSSIIISAESFRGMKRRTFEGVEEYIREGGTVVLLKLPELSPFNRIAGIENADGYTKTVGINFVRSFFPGLDSTDPNEDTLPGTSLDVDLVEDVRVIAEDKYSYPIIWERDYGQGRIVVINTTIIEGKGARGVLAQAVSYANDYFVMPVFNSKAVHLDDFPAPIPDGVNSIIHRDYRMKTRSFFKNIWWKDMERIAERQNILYTGFMIGQYNDIVEKDLMGSFYEIHMEDLGYFGRQLYQTGGELGVHGYNHMALVLDGEIDFEDYGYKSWENMENMEYGLTSLKNLIGDIYGEDVRIYSYVPPSNLLTRDGKEAVIKSFPYLKSLSGLFTSGGERGVLLQEVGRDPDFENIYAIPRFSSGLFYTEDVMWSIYNGVAIYGMVSHFLHPDDILDMDRGLGKSWEELRESYENIFKDINKNFPLLDPVVQSNNTRRYIQMEGVEMTYGREGDTIRVRFDNFKGGMNAFVRVRRGKIKEVRGGTYYVVDSNSDYRLYLVKFDREDSEILLGGV